MSEQKMGDWNQLLKGFWALFLKSNCPLCDRPAEDTVCKYCRRQLQRCQFAKPEQFWAEEGMFVWGTYGGSLKRAIAAMKYENHPDLAKPLGHWLGEAWMKSPISAQNKQLTVVPIPMHAAKLKKRGFNQAELLAKSFCELTGLPLRSQGLERIRDTKAQFGLSKAEREKNLAGAFILGKAFRDRHPSGSVLLLDDIYTSGATAKYTIQVLRNSGIKVCGVAAIATTKQEIKTSL